MTTDQTRTLPIDGINDAPAFTQADMGLAISTGTDIVIGSSDAMLGGDCTIIGRKGTIAL